MTKRQNIEYLREGDASLMLSFLSLISSSSGRAQRLAPPSASAKTLRARTDDRGNLAYQPRLRSPPSVSLGHQRRKIEWGVVVTLMLDRLLFSLASGRYLPASLFSNPVLPDIDIAQE